MGRGFLLLLLTVSIGCGDDGSTLEDFLPELPRPTGEPQSVWAGEITNDNVEELIDGPAAASMPGDFFMRNSRARFAIQAPTRVIGVVPQGGNLIDAVALDDEGNDLAGDQFGELGLIYQAGRTCRHDSLTVVQDGSEGGAAVVQAVGVTEANNFINLRGLGILSIPQEIDPDIEDGVECATTYILEPGAETLQVYFTLFNPGDIDVVGPVGTMNDSGGEVGAWAQGGGFERLGIESLTTATDPAPTEYLVYQAPDVAYGVLPRHDDPEISNAHFLIAGVSVMLFGAEALLDFLAEEHWILEMPPGKGETYRVDISVGRDGADAEERFRAGAGSTVAPFTGSVSWQTAGGGVPGARVALFSDRNGDGSLDADDPIVSYFDTDLDGSFEGAIRPGSYFVKAELGGRAVSEVTQVEVAESGGGSAQIELPDPIQVDYDIQDAGGSGIIPGKITVLGRNPASPDNRMFDRFDETGGVAQMIHAIGGSTSVGENPDAPIVLPPGTYRVVASRGTEWSIDSQLVELTAGQTDAVLSFELARVIDTTGYVSSEYHVHQIGSPDSPIPNDLRVRSAISEGVELFAATDHDYVSDLQPVVEELGATGLVRVLPGLEVTPFVYGHFNTWPLERDADTPNGGAVDWARGMEGYAMLPGEIFAAMRDRGAELVQVNHPRTTVGFDFMQYFDRAGLAFDWDNRIAENDILRQPVPNDWLRLPEASLWSDGFNALEVWNGFGMTDSNEDGVRENGRLDMVMRDWFGFLSLGMDVTPIGNSDTHAAVKDPLGMPRTYVRVSDDSPTALETGNITADLIDTLAGRNDAPRDVVVSNGPFITVRATGAGAPVDAPLGRSIDASGGTITFDITVTSPAWAEFDTIELFANETMEVGGAADPSALQPRFCFTARTEPAANDTCALAKGGARPLTVETEDLGDGRTRFRATTSITVDAADIDTRSGASGQDAWFVVRAYGNRAIFPLLLNDVATDATIDTLVSGTPAEVDAILDGAGAAAIAFTAPILVDFDGDGYLAPFAP